ncbi:MAG: hypothetical protein Q4G14_14950 [Paracoccus sp. (in: a-proteobacteria)]|uniref:DUF6950 family protein n=1 Tax=Paracoccus sp. TaxID=267 RepID=UPI0026DECF1F|nr:hypothetical protein [Paracoccus sp. (in: a-proteobacteria)]MDO5614524.1 hypothetical protein [Paracoccus sp. (in: a-proteobacteria)]
MARLIDWQSRLTDYLIATARTPFRPGQQDCALWVAGAVAEMTGENPAPNADYSTIKAGLNVLKSLGFDDHVAFVAAHFEAVHPAFAQPGDIAVVAGDLDQSLGIVLGETVAVLKSSGWGHVPASTATQVFRV